MKEKPALETILNHALEITDPAEQKAYLNEVCDGDLSLREDVESLLAAHFDAEGFMETLVHSKWGEVVEGQSKDAMPTVEELADDFPELEIIELIGKGGMGAVFKARQASLDRFVALKVIPGGWNSAGKFSERFEREAKILAGLNHPGIVTIHDFGERNGRYFFTMEFVDGTDLARMIHGSDLEPEMALDLIPQICDAIQFAHDRGVVHRDIKPGNILLNRDGRVKVADFGIAKLAANPEPEGSSKGSSGLPPDLTEPDGIIGTPRYMAPEQASASTTVDHRADLYALGMVFYEMLVGSPPPEGALPSLPSRSGKLGRRWDQVIRRALENDPERRFQNASEIRTAIESVLSDEKRFTSNRVKLVAVLVVLIAVIVLWPRAIPDENEALVNSLEMKFVPVEGVEGLVSQWETRVRDYRAFAEETGRIWKPPTAFTQTPEHPAVNVSWHDAQAFCQWLTDREHKQGNLPENEVYRLPTDMEWSAMAGLTREEGTDPKERHLGQETIYPWGEEPAAPEGSANLPDLTGQAKLRTAAIADYDDRYAATAPVGKFKANKYGLYDLAGNVWEWTSSNYSFDETHPVLRGGGWFAWDADDGWKSLLASYRRADVEATGSDEWDVGFRVVRGPRSTEEESLFSLILDGDLDPVAQAIVAGADPNLSNKAGQPPLVLAADTGNLEMVQLLQKHGAKLSVSDRRGRTALHAAAELGDTGMVKWLLELGADSGRRTIAKREPFLLAVPRAPVELLELLLDEAGPGCLIRKDVNEVSALTEACMRDSPDETVRWIIQQLSQRQIEQAGAAEVSLWMTNLVKRDSSLLSELLVKVGENFNLQVASVALMATLNFDKEEHCSLLTEALGKEALDPKIVQMIGSRGARLCRPWAIKKYISMDGDLENWDLKDLDNERQGSLLHLAARDKTPSKTEMIMALKKAGITFEKKWMVKMLSRELAQLPAADIRETIQILFDSGGKLEARTKTGATPLISAAIGGNFDAVEKLLELGAKIEVKDELEFTPLLSGIEKGHLGIVKALERRGADFTATNKYGRGVLHVVHRHEEVLQHLLDKKLPMEEKDKDGHTPLILLATYGDEGIIRCLSEAGANIHAISNRGTTPLHAVSRVFNQEKVNEENRQKHAMGGLKLSSTAPAEREERIRAIKLLVEKGGDPMAREADGTTPLHLVAGSGLHEAVDYFLSKGANPNVPTLVGESPLHAAAMGGHLDCVTALVEGGAKFQNSIWGRSLMAVAIDGGNLEVVAFLIARKVPVNDREVGTLAYPVHLAAGQGRVEMLKALLTAGAKTDVRDFSGATPLHRAAMFGHRNVVDLLSRKGAKMKVADLNFQSPADYAAAGGHQALANHLRALATQ